MLTCETLEVKPNQPMLEVCEPTQQAIRPEHTRSLAIAFLEDLGDVFSQWRKVSVEEAEWLASALQLELAWGPAWQTRQLNRILLRLFRAVATMDAIPSSLRTMIEQLHVRVHPDHPARFELFAALARVRCTTEEARQEDFLRLRSLHTCPGGRALFGSTLVGPETKQKAQALLDVSEDARYKLMQLQPGEDPWASLMLELELVESGEE